MSQHSARISLDGMLDFIPKSRRSLTPIYEAISNSLEAIVRGGLRGDGPKQVK
jgi:hypothetical protein